MKTIIKLTVAMLLPFGLVACSTHFPSVQGQAVDHQVGAGFSSAQTKIITAIENTGGAVTRNGKSVTLMLPTGRVFAPKSYAIRESSLQLLSYSTQLLATFNADQIIVEGFNHYSQDIAMRQAKVVQNYFYDHKVYARFMYSQGQKIDPASNEIERIEVKVTLD